MDIEVQDNVEELKPRKSKRSENIAVLLYPDNPDHEKALIIIRKKFDFTYILHDKDVFENEEDEEQKKPHWHVLLHFSSARVPEQIAKILQIESRFVQYVSNRDAFIRYMLHLDDKDKYQYSINDIQSNRRIIVLDALRHAKSMSERAYEMVNLIIQNKDLQTYGELWCFLIQEGYFQEANKLKSVIRDLWYEHCVLSKRPALLCGSHNTYFERRM